MIFRKAHNETELLGYLEELRADVVRSGSGLVLHIECHGDAHYMELADGSHVAWSELRDILVPINIASRMNVILVLACCSGVFFTVNCALDKPSPFAALLSTHADVSAAHSSTACEHSMGHCSAIGTSRPRLTLQRKRGPTFPMRSTVPKVSFVLPLPVT